MAALSKLSGIWSPRYTTVAAIVATAVWIAAKKAAHSRRKRRADVAYVIGDKQDKKERAAVDGVFFSRLWRILKIIIPGVFTQETWYIVMVAIALAARTYADVWMIQSSTSIESAIISRNFQLFKTNLFRYIYALPAIAIVNSLLKYGLSELKLCFRERLTKHLYEKYLSSFTYYKMSNLDNRISNADQLLTQDVEKFCSSVGELYSNLSKPLLDIAIYTARLTDAIGIQGPASMLGYLVLSGLILTRLRRPVGRMTMMEQKLEGEYRFVNARLITNSEEIAFYQGNRKERNVILVAFQKLVDHLRTLIFFRFNMGLVDNIVAKYLATAVGFYIVSRPFLDFSNQRHASTTHSERLEDYYKSGRMLVRMAEAIGRIVLAGRELTRLAGFTARVTEFMDVLDDLTRGKYERTMVTSKQARLTDKEDETGQSNVKVNLKPGSGRVIIKDHLIRFEHVPLVTPNGDVLVNELNFEVKSGQNVVVCGPNGCGKSSLFRILGELWPTFGGTLTKPDAKHLFYIPQRPYMTLGTLRDQLIYPDTKAEQQKRGINDRQLTDILSKVHLEYILEREGGWDAVQDWMDVLSGGEKQRIAMARLFYHKPQFAILDECTSACSMDVEGYMYQYCKEVGITLFTVSHRKSLWKHHEYVLHMDGRGSFDFKPITADTVEFGS